MDFERQLTRKPPFNFSMATSAWCPLGTFGQRNTLFYSVDGTLIDCGEYQQYEVGYDQADYLRTSLNPMRIYQNDESRSFRTMVGEFI